MNQPDVLSASPAMHPDGRLLGFRGFYEIEAFAEQRARKPLINIAAVPPFEGFLQFYSATFTVT